MDARCLRGVPCPVWRILPGNNLNGPSYGTWSENEGAGPDVESAGSRELLFISTSTTFFTIRVSSILPVKPDLADFLPEMLQFENYWCNQKAGTDNSQKAQK